MSQSKYDNSWIYDDLFSSTVPLGIRGSGTYFRKVRGDLYAFLQEFRMQQLFTLLRRRILAWHKSLHKQVRQTRHFSYGECRFSQSYCYERLQAMLKYIKKNVYLGFKVTQHFSRFEFQKRGAVHMHLLIWLDTDDISLFVHGVRGDLPRYSDDPFLHTMVRRYQSHTHGKYFSVQTKHCRFNFPKPLVNDSYLDTSQLQCFIMRKNAVDQMTNCYNPEWLQIWRSNMDITIVTNTNICKFVTKHCTKEEPFNVEEEIVNECKNYIKTRDYSIHEIERYCMGNHATEFSTQVVRIELDCSRPENRYLKCISSIKELPEDSTDTYFRNAVDKYEKRSTELETLTIIEYFKQFHQVPQPRSSDTLDLDEVYWRKRCKESVVRIYPYLTEFAGNDYYLQIVIRCSVAYWWY